MLVPMVVLKLALVALLAVLLVLAFGDGAGVDAGVSPCARVGARVNAGDCVYAGASASASVVAS